MGILGYIERVVRSWGPRGYIAGVKRYPLDAFPEATRARASGVAKPWNDGLFEAPMTGRPCVFYEIEILETVASGQYQTKQQIAYEQRGLPFVLVDETGQATIDPAHARMVCRFDRRGWTVVAKAEPRENALIDHFALRSRISRSSHIHFREAAITIDEPITIVGMATRVPAFDAAPQRELGYRDGGTPMRLHFATTATNQIIISDDPIHRLRAER